VLEDRCLLSTGFRQINLDSNIPGLARVTDPNLVNPWGISFSPTGAFWFGDNGTSVSDVVGGNGSLLPVVVKIPGAGGGLGVPTGTVYNGSFGFAIQKNGVSAPAHFLFASEDGTISAWNPNVDDASALVVIDNSSKGADYKGLAIATNSNGQTFLYAADFGRGEIDVFDQNFHQVSTGGSFTDPNIPVGYAPFNLQNINGHLFVTYAKQEPGDNEAVPGAGEGYIDIFSPSGNLEQRLASGGPLNAPWGMAVAPTSFGSLAGSLLVGNNGDGHISAYNINSDAYLGQLTDSAGDPIAINGLWGLTVGNDHLAGNSQTLFFAAGMNWGQDGLFGAIQNLAAGQTSTAGTLPYDISSDDDDYPLPPTRGPTLGSDSGQPAPTPVLLPTSNSSLALAPTLTLSPEFSADRTGYAFLAAPSPAGPTSMPDSTTSIIISVIPGPGALTAFSLTSPLEWLTWDLPAGEVRGRQGRIEVNTLVPISLLFLGPRSLADAAETETDTLLLGSPGEKLLQPPSPSSIGLLGAVPWDFVRHDIRTSVEVELNVVPSQERNEPKEEALPNIQKQQPMTGGELAEIAEGNNSPATPLHIYVFRGLTLAVAMCLPWNHFGPGRWRRGNWVALQGESQDSTFC
jgi:uncharacterized protein (TIGR03118 family)